MEEKVIQKSIPVIALRGLVVMPDMMLHFDLNREKSIRAAEISMEQKTELFLVSQKNPAHRGQLPKKLDQGHGDRKHDDRPQQHGSRRTVQRKGLPQPWSDAVADIEMQQINAHGAL